VSAAEDRYLRPVVATVENPQFSVSRIDIDRGGPTYTVDTLRDLRALNPDTDLFFITGADALAQILTWRDSEELFSLAHFIGVTRPGHHLSDAGLPAGGVSLLEVPALAISSTDCRARVAKGDPVWYLVPDGVVRYIARREVRRGAGAGRRTAERRIRPAVRGRRARRARRGRRVRAAGLPAGPGPAVPPAAARARPVRLLRPRPAADRRPAAPAPAAGRAGVRLRPVRHRPRAARAGVRPLRPVRHRAAAARSR